MLTSHLGCDDPLLRAHAAWALGRLGGTAAREALASALSDERDREVAAEIETALFGQPSGM